ncbi:MAG: hypothetical protein M3340_06040, partial [Actinomycetota bacterium]|nr:hypothetical protein [Actinomycetota bacterium]
MIAKVEPLTPARALRGPFDYLLPGDMGDVDVGSMLIVPFGRRRLLGVVVDLAEHSDVPPERLVEPLAALDRGVPPELVRLGLWVAEEYCSTPARGLALVLPPGTGTGSRGRRTRIKRVLQASLTAAGAAVAHSNGSNEGCTDGGGGSGGCRSPEDRASVRDHAAPGGTNQDGSATSRESVLPRMAYGHTNQDRSPKAGREHARLGPRQLAALTALSPGPRPASELCRA